MKKVKLSFLVILTLGCFVALAQAIKDVSSSVGNGMAMEHNLNYPNAVNPAKDNCQKYEKDGKLEANEHPEKNLSNNYDRNSYEETKK